MVERAITALRAAGVININFDLIYGLPYQNTASLCRTVEQCVAAFRRGLDFCAVSEERCRAVWPASEWRGYFNLSR
jgi:hypothetical protein